MPAKSNHNINTHNSLRHALYFCWEGFSNSLKGETDLWSWICFYRASISVVLVLVPHSLYLAMRIYGTFMRKRKLGNRFGKSLAEFVESYWSGT